MGIDIQGWIEFRENFVDEWISVVKVGALLDRNYDMFACLFGVMNYANFRPIAHQRGIPEETSVEVKRDFLAFGTEALFPTWITWDEIQGIDWNEVGVRCDERVHQYRTQPDGQLLFVSKGLRPNAQTLNFDVESKWEADGLVFKIEKIARADALADAPAGWPLLFNIMQFLAQQDLHRVVRLVVWFYG